MTLEERLARLEDEVAGLEALAGSSRSALDPDKLYKPAEVADYLRCGKTLVYDLFAARDLAVIRVGAGKSALRVQGADLLAFVESRQEGGPKPCSKLTLQKYLPR